MNEPFSTSSSMNPDSDFAHAPSIAQAANDLRNAAGAKARVVADTAREVADAASAQAGTIKDRAVEAAQNFRATATEKAQAFKSTATERAQAFKSNATERAQAFKSAASDQWLDTRDKSRELHSAAEHYIRENPTKCVLGALGAGFLLGLIMRR